MKRYIITLFVASAAFSTYGILVQYFSGWDDLINRTPDIIVARCTSTLEFSRSNTPVVIMDGMIPSDIEVLSVLKGTTKPGQSHMSSQYWPHLGEQFLLFGYYQQNDVFTGYQAVEGFRVVKLNRYFQTNQIAGKSLQDQIRWILNSRLRDLNTELGRGQDEKMRIQLVVTNIIQTNSSEDKTNIVPKSVLNGSSQQAPR